MGLGTVLVLVACGDDTPTGLRGIAVVSGSGQVAITVSEGVTPTITWSGGNALRFTITQADGGGVCWDIEALDSAVSFSAPVNFGLVPNTARERSDEVILTAGTNYCASVTLVDGTQGSRVFRVTSSNGTTTSGGTTF